MIESLPEAERPTAHLVLPAEGLYRSLSYYTSASPGEEAAGLLLAYSISAAVWAPVLYELLFQMLYE